MSGSCRNSLEEVDDSGKNSFEKVEDSSQNSIEKIDVLNQNSLEKASGFIYAINESGIRRRKQNVEKENRTESDGMEEHRES